MTELEMIYRIADNLILLLLVLSILWAIIIYLLMKRK